jgi:hypothetical protein
MMKKILNKLIRKTEGQALPMVLIVMAVGGLIIAPLLTYTSSGLKVGQVYEEITDEFYAADGGVEDGLWQIKYDRLEDLFGASYEVYDYTTIYEYPTTYPVVINDIDVDVSIQNVWIPLGLDPPESPGYAKQLIGAGKLIIAGNISEELTQQIKIYYYKDETDAPLVVNKIGVWLPPGFSYDETAECNLEVWMDANGKDYDRVITPHCGGEAVVWTFLGTVLFTDLPGASEFDYPITSIINFKFIPSQPGRSPEALSWITTSGVSDIPYTWDADVKVYHIESTAGGEGGTIIDAYAIKSELRELGSAISGDYRAIGNSLMIEGTGHGYNPWDIRYELLDNSSAVASDIPASAQVDAAFLYWSGWVTGAHDDTLFWDDCSNFNKWDGDTSDDWELYPSYGTPYEFAGHHYGSEDDRYLTMLDTIDLSTALPGSTVISWNQSESGNLEGSGSNKDCLMFQFYNELDGWGTWYTAFCGNNPPSNFSLAIPTEYLTENFRMRFYLDGFNSGSGSQREYAYIDNIRIAVQSDIIADISAIFKINGNQVYFADDEYGNPTVPTEGSKKITADKWHVLETYDPMGGPQGYSFACFKDVTGLVQTFSNLGSGTKRTGNGTYIVGDIYADTGSQWSYAGWSLIIIYSSPETHRHQLYLFDTFYYIAPHTDGLKFSISGFLVPDPIAGEVNAAQITCFVGDGDACYSGDFIAINAPDVPGDQIPESYKLWDSIELGPTTYIPNMSNNANSPNNVWNSRSLTITADGIDIDTFYVPWGVPSSDGLLKPGDSSAEVVLNYADSDPIGAELINFIYIILSFRSSTITGGTVTYLVRG